MSAVVGSCMLFKKAPILEHPFPHVVVDDYLDCTVYRELSDAFPDCPPASGPTGYTCFWGDARYEQLMATSPAWAALFQTVQSQAMVVYALDQFRDTFVQYAAVDLSSARYVSYCESRADKERRAIRYPVHESDELWVRLDIMQGHIGYHREPHLDHRRRAISLLIYFCDADENDMVGGDLVLHGPGEKKAIVRPKHNRMVAFPCHKWSVHSVSPIQAQARPRNFVQITISSSRDVWMPGVESRKDTGRLRLKLRSALDKSAKLLAGSRSA